jgi:hypothetical protein
MEHIMADVVLFIVVFGPPVAFALIALSNLED